MPARVSKNQRTDVKAAAKAAQGRARLGEYEKPACGYCGALTRRKFPPSRGASGRWRVCQNGHQIYRKQR